jgi:integrase
VPAIPIRSTSHPARADAARKPIPATQSAIDALPLNSGTWRIDGFPGLYIRCRRASKSFYVQRKIRGRLERKNLGQLSWKEAKLKALSTWGGMKSTTDSGSFSDAFHRYLELNGGKLRDRTVKNYQYEFDKYLTELHTWSMADLGADAGRREVQRQQSRIRKQHGKAAANRAMRLVSTVYRKACRTDSTLPQQSPTIAIDLDSIQPKQSALDDAALRAWGKEVQTLTPVKQMWWISCLLTGARQESINMLKWEDVDIDRKIIKFWKAKRESYVVPAADILCKLLADYKASGVPSDWIFPSPVLDDQPLQHVREKPKKKGEGPRIPGPQSLRHTHKTRGVGVISPEVSRLLLGHGATGRDVNFDYITLALIVEPLRPAANWYADQYAKILPELLK